MLSLFRPRPSHVVIDDAATAIPARMGKALLALILHGDHAEQIPQADLDAASPIHLLILLQQIDPETMQRLADTYDEIRGHKRIAAMVMTPDEMHGSTDVFPITFLEMKRCHKLLAGDDLLSDLPIELGHLRLRCEQELKNLLLRMQNTFLTNYNRPRSMREAMHRNYASFSRTMGAALLLLDKQRPTTRADLLQVAADAFQLDGDVIQRISYAAAAKFNLHSDARTSLYAAFIDTVGQAAAAIDQLPESVSVVQWVEEETP